MTSPHPSIRQARILDSFEQAWSEGERPDLASYLPPDDPDRLRLLIELAAMDLEFSWKTATPTDVQEYFARFPELLANRPFAVRLILGDYRLRSLAKPITLAYYRERFPDLADELVTVEPAALAALCPSLFQPRIPGKAGFVVAVAQSLHEAVGSAETPGPASTPTQQPCPPAKLLLFPRLFLAGAIAAALFLGFWLGGVFHHPEHPPAVEMKVAALRPRAAALRSGPDASAPLEVDPSGNYVARKAFRLVIDQPGEGFLTIVRVGRTVKKVYEPIPADRSEVTKDGILLGKPEEPETILAFVTPRTPGETIRQVVEAASPPNPDLTREEWDQQLQDRIQTALQEQGQPWVARNRFRVLPEIPKSVPPPEQSSLDAPVTAHGLEWREHSSSPPGTRRRYSGAHSRIQVDGGVDLTIGWSNQDPPPR